MPEPFRLLILGGTGEARALAAAVEARFGAAVRAISSLAGRTAAPPPIAGAVRRGGFGGAAGLAAYLAAERIDALVDATHPFATTMRAAALAAAERARVPRLLLDRPPWRPEPDDRWIEAGDAAGAAALLPALGRRAWLTLGVKELAPFAGLAAMWFLVRRIDPGPVPLANATVILGRGPFTHAGEAELIGRHRIDVVVSKASGGAATHAKLVAARAARIPVVMIRRPPPPAGPAVGDVAAALDWIAARIASRQRAAVSR